MEKIKLIYHAIIVKCKLLFLVFLSMACTTGHAANYESFATKPMVLVKVQGELRMTLDKFDRVRLCKQAAKGRLEQHNLDWRDVYAIVDVETDWAPRDGMGNNKVKSIGLAQLEPSTAKSLNVDPNNTVESLSAVVSLLQEAALWSKTKKHRLDSGSISVYYNLSTAARNKWLGNLNELPIETQRHVLNFFNGKATATKLHNIYETNEEILDRIYFKRYKTRFSHRL